MTTKQCDPRAVECLDYIMSVREKQGWLPDAKTLYGDGSRFGLTFKGFELVYGCVLDAVKQVHGEA